MFLASLVRKEIPRGVSIFENEDLQLLWDRGVKEDIATFIKLYSSIWYSERAFPTELGFKTSLSECAIDGKGALCFRRRLWIPNWEPLKTALIQRCHDSNHLESLHTVLRLLKLVHFS